MRHPNIPTVVTAVAVVLGTVLAAPAWSQGAPSTLDRYRGYALNSSVEAVTRAGSMAATDVRTVHERPARIQELEWRAPYVRPSAEAPDPVRAIAFSFCDDELYRIVVDYDRDRTDGMTDRDLVDSLVTVYGPPRAGTGQGRSASYPDQVVLAHWSTANAVITLLRGAYSPGVQLILASPAVSARARRAIADAIRQDVADAPRRAADERRKEAADASAAREKQRATNRSTFRP